MLLLFPTSINHTHFRRSKISLSVLQISRWSINIRLQPFNQILDLELPVNLLLANLLWRDQHVRDDVDDTIFRDCVLGLHRDEAVDLDRQEWPVPSYVDAE